jgi:hypothetical protein
MIGGTAGHIDHGKTSLVRQLTGVDGGTGPRPHSGRTPIRGEVPDYRRPSTKSKLLTMNVARLFVNWHRHDIARRRLPSWLPISGDQIG